MDDLGPITERPASLDEPIRNWQAARERGVAAASIDDQRRDYRDWLLSLGDLYLAGIKAKLDPAPVLRRIAERSNRERHRAAPTPTRDVLEGFEQSAYFGTTILPHFKQ